MAGYGHGFARFVAFIGLTWNLGMSPWMGVKSACASLNWFQEDGSLSEEGVVRVLRQRGFLPDRVSTFPGEAVRVTEGLRKQNNKVYRVSVNRWLLSDVQQKEPPEFSQKFVIKYFVRSEDIEADHLAIVRTSPLTRLPMSDREFPVVTLDEGTSCYRFADQTHCFTILHAAKGSSVHSLLQKALGERGSLESARVIRRAFFQTGRALAKIHLRFAKDPGAPITEIRTTAHGDAHSENIFFDPVGDRIYLIDNEYFAETMKAPVGVEMDLQAFVEWVSTLETDENLDLFKDLYSEFVRGYAGGFKAPDKLSEQLSTWVENFRARNSAHRLYADWPIPQ